MELFICLYVYVHFSEIKYQSIKKPQGMEFLKAVMRNQKLSQKSKGMCGCVRSWPIHYLPLAWCHSDEWSWKSYIALHRSHLQYPMWAKGWHVKFQSVLWRRRIGMECFLLPGFIIFLINLSYIHLVDECLQPPVVSVIDSHFSNCFFAPYSSKQY